MVKNKNKSCVPVPEHVAPTQKVGDIAPDFIEASMCHVMVANGSLVSAIAERGVRTELTIANLLNDVLYSIHFHLR